MRTRNGPGNFEGKFAVFRLSEVSISGIGADLDGGSTSTGLLAATSFRLDIGDFPPWCGQTDAGTLPDRIRSLTVEVNRLHPRTVTTGDYAFGVNAGDPTEWPHGWFAESRATCYGPASYITTGKFSLARLTDSEAQGDLSVTLTDGTVLEGEFLASKCPPLPGFSPDLDSYPAPLPPCAP